MTYIYLVAVIFALAVIGAYIILVITDWLEEKANKKFPIGKIKKGEHK